MTIDSGKLKDKHNAKAPDAGVIMDILNQHKDVVELFSDACVHCTFCSESCFMQNNHERDPSFMPSYKVIHSTIKLYRRKGRVSWEDLEQIRDIVWKKCVLCTRCYCPMHLNIPQLISIARDICRSQGVIPETVEDQTMETQKAEMI